MCKLEIKQSFSFINQTFLQQAKIHLLPSIGTPRVGVDLQAPNPFVETNR
jgi:hypothetical protein